MITDLSWDTHPYTPAPEFQQRVAYISMEFGIDTALKVYSGGLGYLAGSHMRSAAELKQNMIGIGMLWKFGYYDQVRNASSHMRVLFRERFYPYVQPTDIIFPITVNGHEIKVQAFYMAPTVFNTVPMYFLTTDREEFNDYLACSISHHLYDKNTSARIAQSIVLGIGSAKLIEKLGGTDFYHLNEAHALPLAFQLYQDLGSVKALREKLRFTTHTPVKAGNEERDVHQLHRMGFFAGLSREEAQEISGESGDRFGYTPAALRLSGRANGVSQLHAKVSNTMWDEVEPKSEIIGITNAQNQRYWQDKEIKSAVNKNDVAAYKKRKRKMKRQLFRIVADQTGKYFDPDVLTIVWARRFAAYKRADLIISDRSYFNDLVNNPDRPVQMIWAGKPYPFDEYSVDLFNELIDLTRANPRAAVLTGYEMKLSQALKKGSDVWLNNPRRPKEASGTSGMTAAMNGSINFSIQDGWIPEWSRHKHNSFLIPVADETKSVDEQDEEDYQHMLRILTEDIIPCYYERPEEWQRIAFNGIREITPFFDSGRMAREYYERMYI